MCRSLSRDGCSWLLYNQHWSPSAVRGCMFTFFLPVDFFSLFFLYPEDFTRKKLVQCLSSKIFVTIMFLNMFEWHILSLYYEMGIEFVEWECTGVLLVLFTTSYRLLFSPGDNNWARCIYTILLQCSRKVSPPYLIYLSNFSYSILLPLWFLDATFDYPLTKRQILHLKYNTGSIYEANLAVFYHLPI